MPSVRLTNFDRDEIRGKAITAAFAERMSALDAREHALAKEAYEFVIPAEEREAIAKVPAHWMRLDPCLGFNVAGASVKLQTGAGGYPVPYMPKGSQSGSWRCHDRLGTIPAGDLADRIMSLLGDKESLKAERSKAQAALQAMLASINTTGKLGETWPEGKPFFEHLEKARDGAAVPSVRVEEINSLLGLKTAA